MTGAGAARSPAAPARTLRRRRKAFVDWIMLLSSPSGGWHASQAAAWSRRYANWSGSRREPEGQHIDLAEGRLRERQVRAAHIHDRAYGPLCERAESRIAHAAHIAAGDDRIPSHAGRVRRHRQHHLLLVDIECAGILGPTFAH